MHPDRISDYNSQRVRPSPVTRFSPERRRELPEETAESITDSFEELPKIFMEELLDQRFDNQLSIAILKESGPLTLLLFNRSLDLSHRYHEFKELRLYPLPKNVREDLVNTLSKRLLSFLHFTWHMAQKDLMHQWRI